LAINTMGRQLFPVMVKIFDLFDALRLANSAGLVAPAIGFKKKDVFNIRLAWVTS